LSGKRGGSVAEAMYAEKRGTWDIKSWWGGVTMGSELLKSSAHRRLKEKSNPLEWGPLEIGTDWLHKLTRFKRLDDGIIAGKGGGSKEGTIMRRTELEGSGSKDPWGCLKL